MNRLYKVIAVCLIGVFLSACGNAKTICGHRYDTYGFFDTSEAHPQVKYELIVGNAIWSVILLETAFFPIYFFGFSIYEPVGSTVPCDQFDPNLVERIYNQ